MSGRTALKVGLGAVLLALVALLLDQDLLLEEAREAADAPGVAGTAGDTTAVGPDAATAAASVDVDGLWVPDSVVTADGTARARGLLAHHRGYFALVLLRADSTGAPTRADVEAGRYDVRGDTLVVEIEGIAEIPAGGGRAELRVDREGAPARAVVAVEGDQLAATFPDGRRFFFHRADAPDADTDTTGGTTGGTRGAGDRAVGAVQRRLPGAWEARTAEPADGPDQVLAGRLVFADGRWVGAYFMVDSAGAPHRVVGEHGRYRMSDGTLHLTVNDRATWGEERPGRPATPPVVEVDVDETVEVRTAGSASLLVLRFPDGRRLRLVRFPSSATAR